MPVIHSQGEIEHHSEDWKNKYKQEIGQGFRSGISVEQDSYDGIDQCDQIDNEENFNPHTSILVLPRGRTGSIENPSELKIAIFEFDLSKMFNLLLCMGLKQSPKKGSSKWIH